MSGSTTNKLHYRHCCPNGNNKRSVCFFKKIFVVSSGFCCVVYRSNNLVDVLLQMCGPWPHISNIIVNVLVIVKNTTMGNQISSKNMYKTMCSMS